MDHGVLITKAAVWGSLAAYVAAMAILAVAPANAARRRTARIVWSVGCAAMWGHVTAAFAVYHNWSHAAAAEQTARETAAVVGFEFPQGVWFNYLFLAVWTGDAAWWWSAPAAYARRPRWISFAVHGYLAFIAFNAVVVFETGWLRGIGIVATATLTTLWWRGRRRDGRRPRPS